MNTIHSESSKKEIIRYIKEAIAKLGDMHIDRMLRIHLDQWESEIYDMELENMTLKETCHEKEKDIKKFEGTIENLDKQIETSTETLKEAIETIKEAIEELQ